MLHAERIGCTAEPGTSVDQHEGTARVDVNGARSETNMRADILEDVWKTRAYRTGHIMDA
jgi:hypothetical protein